MYEWIANERCEVQPMRYSVQCFVLWRAKGMAGQRHGQALAWRTPAELQECVPGSCACVDVRGTVYSLMQPHVLGLQRYYSGPVGGLDLVCMLARVGFPAANDIKNI